MDEPEGELSPALLARLRAPLTAEHDEEGLLELFAAICRQAVAYATRAVADPKPIAWIHSATFAAQAELFGCDDIERIRAALLEQIATGRRIRQPESPRMEPHAEPELWQQQIVNF